MKGFVLIVFAIASLALLATSLYLFVIGRSDDGLGMLLVALFAFAVYGLLTLFLVG